MNSTTLREYHRLRRKKDPTPDDKRRLAATAEQLWIEELQTRVNQARSPELREVRQRSLDALRKKSTPRRSREAA